MKNRMEPELSRSEVPPTKPGVWWVEVLKGNDKQKFLVYSPAVQGVDMHWLSKEKRTVPCFKDTSLCPGGHSLANRKWRCYVFAFSYQRRKNVFIQLTKDAWESWMAQCRPGVNLRGQTIQVCRTEKKNGRLWVEVESWRAEEKGQLTANEDCKLSIYDMWGFSPSGIMVSADLSCGDEFSLNGKVLT